MKLYVKETTERTIDGERLKVVKTYHSKPKGKHYIIWKGK